MRLRSELSANCRARAVDVRKMRQGFHQDQNRLAKKQRNELAADRRTCSRAVAKLMDNFKMSRGEMAQELTESLQEFAQRLRSQVSNLREGFREDIQAAHQTWNDLLLAQAGMVAQMAIPASLRHDFGMGEAEEKVTAGEAVRRFVQSAGSSLVAKRRKPKKR